MNQVLSLWLKGNSLVLAGLCLVCLALAASRSRDRRALLVVLALVSALVGSFAYAGSLSVVGAGIQLNLAGKIAMGVAAVAAPALALVTLRFVRQPRRSHA